jgi:hypothetical protein
MDGGVGFAWFECPRFTGVTGSAATDATLCGTWDGELS